MDLIDVNKKEVTLMKYIGPFSPRVPASDSKTLTNIFISKGGQNLEKTNPSLNPLIGGTNNISDIKLSQQRLIPGDEDNDNKSSENLGIVIKSNMADRNRVGMHVNGKKTLTNLCTSKMCTDVSASFQLKADMGTAGINKAIKQCTNLSGGLVDGNLASKSLHSLFAGESSHLSSNIIGMGGIKMAATPHLDHITSKSGIKSGFASSLASSHYSIASGLMDVHQNLRSGLSGANLGIKKGDSDLHAINMDSSKGPALLDTKMNIAAGGCVLDATGLDADGKLNQDKVKVIAKSLNKGNTGIPLPAIFANCQFSLDLSMNMSFSEKTNLRKAITGHGGIVSFIVTKKSTHVICGDPEKVDMSYKCKMATKYGIPIICVDYVRDCVDKGRLLNTDGYLLLGKTKAEELKLGKISASRQQKLEMKQKVRPLFNVKNVKIWTYGEKDCPVFDEENYQIAKYAMFKKLDKSTETTTFCVLELHVVDLKVDGTNEHRFRVFCHHGVLHDVEEGQAGNKEIRFAQTSEEVVAIYVHLYHEQMKPPQSMTLTFDLLSRHVGSQKFRQMMEEIGAECGVISPAVSGLVNYVWEEAVGNLQHNLRGPLTCIKTEQIDKAEGILKQMREAVDENNTMRLSELKDEFYKEIPYQQTVSVSDINKAWISRTFDLCQLIRDLIAVSEATDWSARPSDEAKYSALRCNIEHLESTSPEFKTIKDYLMQSLEGGMSLKVERIFHVHRSAESSNFRMDLEPRRLLFHSSRVDNFMGILSRGLLMPRVVVDDHGGKRTDPGMLGSGIYFAEAGSTSAGYSSPGKTKGTRLMLINEVALGSCFGTTKHNKSLTEPPEGYQSVHGIKATENCPSDFKVDEYVVYNTNQQKIKYLVEFTLPGDIVTAHDVGSILQNQQLFVGRMDKDEVEDLSLKEVDLKDVASVLDPMSKVKAGLVSSGDAPVDLKQVHISARLLDMVSQVVVIQEYNNNSSSPLEAKYVFPLDEMAAICGFEAFINGKHIIGEVKEKETAHKEYKKAISEGHGAYLMDQDEETPDVFTISVGNLPPWATVFIKITYVAELQVEDELISFRLPGSVAPWSKDAALQDKTQSDLATVEVKQGQTSLLVAVEMPFDIRTIECPTHKVKLKKTLTKAVVELCDGQSLSDGFQLLIGLAEIHVPRMWVERKDIDSDHQACMLSFYPEFEASEEEESDVIFLLDLSNSMKGAALTQAKKVLLLTLTHIPKQWTFNVIVFGTGYRELFPGGVCKTPENVKKVEKFVQGLKADMGNTEALRPLHSLHLLKQESSLRNVFLITDGHVNNEETTLAEIHGHCQNTRIFTFGVSSTANRHLLRALARMGGGAFEFFDPKSKSKWEGKVKSQISKAGHIGLTSISVHWEQYNSDVAAPVQAPKNINAIFSGSRQVIYGFVPNCTMATLKAQIDGQEVSTVVSTSDLNITEGKILHRLTARAIIRDWEDGLLSLDRADQEIMKATTKNMIIELSKEYSIVTQFTSFVAIEKRDEDKEVDESELLDMNDLIGREAMDILQSMGYLSSSSPSSSSSSSDEAESWEEEYGVDQGLEDMQGMLENLKTLAADMEAELHAQNSQLDRINDHDVMCAEYEDIYDDGGEEWGGGGGGGGEMLYLSAEMPNTLSIGEMNVMCADSNEYEDIYYDGGEEWGGGGGGMPSPSAAMPMTLSGEVAVICGDSIKYDTICDDDGLDEWGGGGGGGGGMPSPSAAMPRTLSKEVKSAETFEYEGGRRGGIMDCFGMMKLPKGPRAMVDMSVDDSVTCDSSLQAFHPIERDSSAVHHAEQEESYEDMGFGLFGDDDKITASAQTSAKDEITPDSFTRMPSTSITFARANAQSMPYKSREVARDTAELVQEQAQEERKASSPVQPEFELPLDVIRIRSTSLRTKRSADVTEEVARPSALLKSHGGESAEKEMFDVNKKEKKEKESFLRRMTEVSSTRMPSTSFPITFAANSLYETQEVVGNTADLVQEQVQEERKASSPVQPELDIIQGHGLSIPFGTMIMSERSADETVEVAGPPPLRGILRRSKSRRSADETVEVAGPPPLLGKMSMLKIRRSADETADEAAPPHPIYKALRRSMRSADETVEVARPPAPELMREQSDEERKVSSPGQPKSDVSWLAEQAPIFTETGGSLSTLRSSTYETVEAAKQPAPISSYSGTTSQFSSAKYKRSAPIKMSKEEGEAVHPSSASPSRTMHGVAPLDMRVHSKRDFPGKKETPQVGTLFESVALAPPEIQSKSLFESAPSQSHVPSEGRDTSQRQPMFGFGASRPSTLTASFASQPMFPSSAAFGSAAHKSSVLFGSQPSEKLSQNEPAHAFGAYTSSSLPDQFSSWQMFPSQEAVGFAVPTSSVPFRSQSSEKISPKELEHGFEAPMSSWSLRSQPMTASGSLFKPDVSQPSQSAPQSHFTFGFSSFAPSGQVASQPSQSVPQSHFTFGSSSFAPSGQVAFQQSQSVPQSHFTFGFAKFKPDGRVPDKPSQPVFQSLSADRFKPVTPTGQVTGQPVYQGHSSFGSASFATAGSVTSQPSQPMFQSLSADGFESFKPTGPVASHPIFQSHPTFGFASFAPTVPSQQMFQKQSGFKGLEETETLSAPSQPKVESESLFGSTKTSSSFWVAQAEKGKFKEPQPQPSVLKPLPPPPPPPPAHLDRYRSISSAPAPEQYLTHMEKEMMVSPVLERKLLWEKRKLECLAKPTPTQIQSALNILDVQKAPPPPPPPLPPLAEKMSPLPIPEQRLQQLDTRHLETEEKSHQYPINTSPQVSWRTSSVPAVRGMRNIYRKSEVAELTGAFERIQSRSLARMEHEPLLDSLDIMQESLLIEGDMLGEAVTTDLGRYGIGLNVECIAVRPMKGLPANTVECIMKLQKEDGHWEFDADLEQILGVDKNLCLHILYTAGLKSMGESAVQAIIQLATTLIVLLSIYKHLFPSSHVTNLRQVDEQNNMYNKIRTTMSKLGFGQQFDNAMAYCNRMKRQHSLVPATLELGKSWDEMIGKMLDIHCDKSDIKTQSEFNWVQSETLADITVTVD